MLVADANIVIAATNPAHAHHREANHIVTEHGREGIVLHSLTLAEILVGPAKNGAQQQALSTLTAAGFALPPDGGPPPENLALVRAATALKMPDASVLATAEHLGLALATFDARLARAAEGRGVTVLGA